MLLLLQADTTQNWTGVWIWSLVLVGALLLLFVLVSLFRRWVHEEPPSVGGTGFTLADLRELHRAGQMTDAEYERAKAQILAAARKERPDPPPSPENKPGA